MTKTTTVRGLRDGLHTAGTGQLTRKIKALGAEVTVASTGRVTVVNESGVRHVYVLVVDPTSSTSPLTQALADLESCASQTGTSSDLELFLVGLIMAGTVYCDGPQHEDPTEDFDLWRKSWDAAVPAWDHAARGRAWRAVGMSWEYHTDGW